MTSYQSRQDDNDNSMIELLEGTEHYRTVLIQEIVGFTSPRKLKESPNFRVSVTLLGANKEKTLVCADFAEQESADQYYSNLKDITSTISVRNWSRDRVGKGAVNVATIPAV